MFDNLFKSQIDFEEESNVESSDTDDSSGEVLKMKARPPSLMNLKLRPLVHALLDALFLDSMAKVFEMDTSEIFLSRVHKFQSVYDEARRSVKKRIESKL